MIKRCLVGVFVIHLTLLGFTEYLRAEIDRVTLRVDGLSCPFCAYGLEKKLKSLKGITSYNVDMKEGKVFLEVKPDTQVEINSFNKAVKEAGFILRSVSLRVRGKIEETEEGLILIPTGSNGKFLLFEDDILLEKFHQGEKIKTLSEELRKKLLEIKEQGKEVLIEGIVHEHTDYPAGLSVDHLERIE